MKKTMFLIVFIITSSLLLGHSVSQIHQWNHRHKGFPVVQSRDSNRSWLPSQWTYESFDTSWYFEEKMIHSYNSIYPTQVDSTIDYLTNEWGEWYAHGIFRISYDPTFQYMTEFLIEWIGEADTGARILFTYDNQHRLVSEIGQDNTFAGYVDSFRNYWEYSNGTEFTYYYWSYDSNPAFNKDIYTFDSDGRILEDIGQTSADSLNWINDTKKVYSYNPNDTSTGSTLVDYFATTYTKEWYNNMYFMPSIYDEVLDSIWNGSDWVLSGKQVNTYNNQNQMIQTHWLSWNSVLNVWDYNDRDEYTYDNNGNLSTDVYSYCDSDTTNWQFSDRYTYSWMQGTQNEDVTVPASKEIQLHIYPNPFSKELNISNQSKSNQMVKYQIFNLKGQLVSTFDTTPNTSMIWNGKDKDGSNVSSGIYFLKMEQGKNNLTSRFLKIK